MILCVKQFDAFMEAEHQLMQIVCKHQHKQQYRRDRQIVHPFGMVVINGLVDVLHHKETDQGDQHHRNIVRIPNVPCNRVGAVCYKFIFYSTHCQPKGHQHTNCH